MTKTTLQKTFYNTCLKPIFNIRWPERITNEEHWKRSRQEPIDIHIRRRKGSWIGHTLRKPTSSFTRQALSRNQKGKRKRGHPRNTWRRDTEAELKTQVMNWNDAPKAAKNRVRWRTLVDSICSSRNDSPK